MCRVSARWCSTSCPELRSIVSGNPQEASGTAERGGRHVARRTSRSKTRVGRRHESVGDTSRSETRHAGHDSHSHFPPIRPSYVRPPSSEPQSESYEEEAGDTSLGGLRSPRDLRSKSDDDGRSKSVEPSFLRQSHSKLSTWPRLLPSANVSTSLTHHTGGTRRGRRGRRVCVCVGS